MSSSQSPLAIVVRGSAIPINPRGLRNINEIFRQKPDLKFAGQNHFTHQQIVCPIVGPRAMPT
jgi:hypothetical protein